MSMGEAGSAKLNQAASLDDNIVIFLVAVLVKSMTVEQNK